MATILAYQTAARCWTSGVFDDACIPPDHLDGGRMVSGDRSTSWASLLAADRASFDYRMMLHFMNDQIAAEPNPYRLPQNDYVFKLNAARRNRLQAMFGELAANGVHVLVPDPSDRIRIKNAIPHVRTSPLPPGSLVRLLPNEDLFATSPELTFLQMATVLDTPKLAQLGCELCSSYYFPPDEPGTFANRQLSLTSTEALEAFLGRCGNSSQVRRAQRAVRCTIDAAHSPMETVLALLLTLPMRYGGYGLPKPSMNYPVETQNSRDGGRTTRFVDLCWPESKVAVEYYGREYHGREEDETRDTFRQNDLVAEGWTLFVITKEHFAVMERLESVAGQIAERIGHRLRQDRLKPFPVRRQLVTTLMSGNSLAALADSKND